MISVDYNGHAERSRSAAEKAFCAGFFFLPISKPLLFLSLLAAFLLFAVQGGIGTGGWRKLRALPWTVPALILALLPVASLALHDDRAAAWSHLGLAYYWLLAFGVFLAASRHSACAVRDWLRGFVLGVFLVFAWSQAINAGLVPLSWMPAALVNYILYSQLLAMAVVVLSVLYRHESDRRLRLLYLLTMAAFYAGLLTGDGRSGLLAVVVLLPFVALNLFPRAGMGRVLLACALAVAVLLLSPRVQTRIMAAVSDLQLMEHQVTETSLGYRMEMWRTAAGVVRAHPVFGAGPEAFNAAWHSRPRTGQGVEFVEPHNAFLFFAASYGLIGVAALIWLMAALLETGWRHRRTPAGGVVFAFAVIFLIGAFTNTMFRGSVSQAWLMLFMGLQGALLPERRRHG